MLAPTVSLQVNSVALSHISFSPKHKHLFGPGETTKRRQLTRGPSGKPKCLFPNISWSSWSTGRLLHTTMQITQIPGHTRRRIRNRSHRTSSLVLGTSATNLPRIWSKLRRRRHTQALIRFRTQGDVSRVMCGSSA